MRMTLRLAILGCSLLFVFFPQLTKAAPAEQPRMINIHGTEIASIFYGLSPNPEYARLRTMEVSRVGSCPTPKATTLVFHPGHSQLLEVQQDCTGHYMTAELQICGSVCGTGDEQWTHSDPDAPYDIRIHLHNRLSRELSLTNHVL